MSSIEAVLARIECKQDSKVDYKAALAITVALVLIMLGTEIFAMFARP